MSTKRPSCPIGFYEIAVTKGKTKRPIACATTKADAERVVTRLVGRGLKASYKVVGRPLVGLGKR